MKRHRTNQFSIKQTLMPTIRMHTLLGTWPPGDEFKYTDSLLYSSWAFFMLILVFTLDLLCQIINLPFIYNDLEVLATSISFLVCKLNCATKAIFMLKNFSAMRRLMKRPDNDTMQPLNKKQLDIINCWMRLWNIIFITSAIALPVECICIAISPFLDESNTVKLIFISWYPYNYEESTLLFVLTYIHQAISYGILGYLNVNCDMLYMGLMMHVAAECDVLGYSFRNLHVDYTCDTDEDDRDENLEVKSQNEDKRKMDERFGKNLLHCIQLHNEIVSHSSDIQKILNVPVVGQLMASLLSFAVTMFLVSMIEMTSFQFAGLMIYLIGVIGELFLLCWTGNAIIERSTVIFDAAYASRWYEGSVSNAKDLLFTMQRLKKPIKLYGLGFFELSLPTFLWILRSSISYCTILREMDAREGN